VNEILYTVCRELSWSHIRLIMRLDTEKARKYYLNEARAQGGASGFWSGIFIQIILRGLFLRKTPFLQISILILYFTIIYLLILPTEEELTAELERNVRYLREARGDGE